MTTNIICSVINHKNKLAIGQQNKSGSDLLIKLKNDLSYFKMKTTTRTDNGRLPIIVMGRNTWESIKKRTLKDRVNVIVTRDKDLIKRNGCMFNIMSRLTCEMIFTSYMDRVDPFFISLEMVYSLIKSARKKDVNVFIIGGSFLINTFLHTEKIEIDNIFLTEIKNVDVNNIHVENSNKIDKIIYIDHIPDKFSIVNVSGKEYETVTINEKTMNVEFRFLTLKKNINIYSSESKYLDLMSNVILSGNKRIDRTGTGTLSIFGTRINFDISNSIPVMTTKKIHFRGIVEELLWILRGDTDAKILNDKGITIWNGNTTREFLDSRKLSYPDGIAGPIYGFQLRNFNAPYNPQVSATMKIDNTKGIDQLENVLYLLKNDPFSRRIMFSYWNPQQLDEMCLPPCFLKGTLILTDNGYKKIENVLLTDNMFTHLGNWKKIVNIQERDYNDTIYKISFENNSTPIFTTNEHPFLVRKKFYIIHEEKRLRKIRYSEPYWCEARNIDYNNVLCLPINKKNIIPYFLIESSLPHIIPRIDIYRCKVKSLMMNNDHSLILGYIFNGKFNADYSVFSFTINHENMYMMISKYIQLNKDGNNTYSFSDEIWIHIMKKIYKDECIIIPEFLHDSPINIIKVFLRGYLNKEKDEFIDIKYLPYMITSNISVERNIAYGLQRLYAKLNIMICITEIDQDLVSIYQRPIEHVNYFNLIDKDYVNFPVSCIEKYKEKTIVYNFQVDDDNSYTVNNISVHNCHISAQFYVEQDKYNDKWLSCHVYQRSQDLFLGAPYNYTSYSILTYILAKKCNMKPKELIYSCGDAHIYLDHINAIKKQISRSCIVMPVLLLDDSIKEKDFSDMTLADFELCGYFHHSQISGKMAI